MRVTVKVPFFDDNGLHLVGDIVEVSELDESRMEKVEEKKPVVRKEKK